MGHCLFMRKGETHTAPISGILASDLAVGSVVKLMESGVAMEYLVVNHGIPSDSSLYDDSCDGLWLLRKDIKEKRQWHSSNVNDYKNSDIHAWLNGDFFNQFGSVEKSAIKQVKIPFVNGTGGSAVAYGVNGLSTKTFLLGGYEIGFDQSSSAYIPIDGAKLSYFDSNDKRIGYLNGKSSSWWSRSLSAGNTTSAWYVEYHGGFSSNSCSNSYGVRPALILPSTAVFDETTMLLKGVA